MTGLEAMAYKMQPAGHDKPSPRRKYSKPDLQLANAFEKWINSVKEGKPAIDDFQRIEDYTKELHPSLDELHSLMIHYQDHSKVCVAGMFLSHFYNKMPEKIILHDLDIGLRFVGYLLAPEKILVNLGKMGTQCGYQARGVIINAGEIGRDLGSVMEPDLAGNKSYSILVNLGKVGDYAGGNSDALIVNVGEAGEKLGWDATGPVLNFGSCGKELGCHSRYVSILVNTGKADYNVGCESDGILISATPAEWKETRKARKVIDSDEYLKIPELVKYVDHLRAMFEPAKQDWKLALKAVEQLGTGAKDKITQDILDIFRRANYDVA